MHRAVIDNHRAVLERMIEESRVISLYQSILDLGKRNIFGFELLSRGMHPLENPSSIREAARECSMMWEVENACLESSFRSLAATAPAFPGCMFFINVEEGFLADQRLLEKLSGDSLRRYGLGPGSIVLEIDSDALSTRRDRAAVCRIWRERGVHLSFDGVTLENIESLLDLDPSFVKPSPSITRAVATFGSAAQEVRAMVSICTKSGCRVIAKMVETPEEAEELSALGVNFLQGYCFSRPQSRPPVISAELEIELLRISAARTASGRRTDRIGLLCEDCLKLEIGSTTNEQMDTMFRRDPSLEVAVVLDQKRPVGLVTRNHFFLSTGGRFGYAVNQFKPVEQSARTAFLVAGDGIPVKDVVSKAMKRPLESLYDPVVVVDHEGKLTGVASVRLLLDHSSGFGSGPGAGFDMLTGLPDHGLTLDRIGEAVSLGVYSAVMFDIDNFKAFNYAFGFVRGDELLRIAAEILSDHAPLMAPGSFLGRVGTASFCLVTHRRIPGEALDNLCRDFDSRMSVLFSPEHLSSGCYFISRSGSPRIRVPLNRMTACVLTESNFSGSPHPAFLVEIASLQCRKSRRSTDREETSTYSRLDKVFSSGVRLLV